MSKINQQITTVKVNKSSDRILLKCKRAWIEESVFGATIIKGGDYMDERDERAQLFLQIEDLLDQTDVDTVRAIVDFIKDTV